MADRALSAGYPRNMGNTCPIPQQNTIKRKPCVDCFAQDCSNSSALAMELLQSCTKPSMCTFREVLCVPNYLQGLLLINKPIVNLWHDQVIHPHNTTGYNYSTMPNFISGSTESPLKFGHIWTITSQISQCMWLLIYGLISVKRTRESSLPVTCPDLSKF